MIRFYRGTLFLIATISVMGWADGKALEGSRPNIIVIITDDQGMGDLSCISVDPGETTDVSAEHPEVVARLRRSYDRWWASVLPLMVNEGLSKVAPADQPLAIRYHQQLNEEGILDWMPADVE